MAGQVVRRGGQALLALCGAGLLAFVVAMATGALGWVVTTGASMAPGIVEGDLVLVRPADAYGVGDVVAYRSPDLRRVVLHRVVAVEDRRLVTRGDANDWVDSHRPSVDEVLGRRWLQVPGGGRHLQALFDPTVVAVLVGATTAVALGGNGRRAVEPCVEQAA